MATEVLRPHDCLTHRIRISPPVSHRRKTSYGYGNGIPKVNKTVISSERPHQRRRSSEQRKSSPVQSRRSPPQRKSSPVRSKRSPEPLSNSKRSASAGDLDYKNINNNLLVAGNVKILRRGESLVSIKANEKNDGEEMAVYGTGRLGPEPMTKQVRVGLPDVYAGSAVTMSPSPRALPVPSFFKKGGGEKCVDDSATKDLRRMLRLD